MTNPKKSQSLHIETLNDELSVYDWQRQQMHSLNPTAASVFELCDGETSPEQMALKLDAPKELIFQSLAELDRAKLLEVEAEKAFWQKDISRRQFVKVGAGVAAAAIVSIMLPSPAAAQSAVVPTAVPTATAIPPATDIVMYNAGGTHDGNLGGRTGADGICAASGNRPSGAEYTNFRAFISVDAADEIRDMPANYGVLTTLPIVGPTGIPIANDWTDLLDGTIAATLQAAGVTGGVGQWMSGAGGDDGSVGTHTCLGWTSNGAAASFNIGSDLATTNWIRTGGTVGCDASNRPLVCIAY